MDDSRATIERALTLLEAEINTRQDCLDALREAAGVLRGTLGSLTYAEMTQHEVMEYLSISRTCLGRYLVGRLPQGKPDFPRPINVRGRTRIYAREEITLWKHAYVIT